MFKKLIVVGFALVMVLGLAGCDELEEWLLSGTTGVEGDLELAAGVEEDLDDTKVYLYDNSDFEGDYEEKVSADVDEDDETEATFEFEDIDADDYYLLAWKDVDDDDEISYGDLVGIYDGKYGEDEPEEIDVDEDEMTDVGTIKMYEYEGGGGGTVELISVSGSLTDYIGYSSYYLDVVFSHDTEIDEYDSEDYAEVGLTFSNIIFSVPSEYQEGCYLIFWADQCAYLEGIGDPYLAEWIYGLYGDQGNREYSSLPLQETYTAININIEWYNEDACPYEYTDVGQYPDLTSTKRIPNAK